MTLIRRRRYLLRWTRKTRWLLFLSLALAAYGIINHIPAPPKTKNNTRADRPPPEHDVEDVPRFLYHSSFREDPDLAYEEKLSAGLQAVEQSVSSAPSYSRRDFGEKTIWQILIGKKANVERGDDSIRLERANPDWTYTLVTNTEATDLISTLSQTIPDLHQIYHAYPHDVLRADLLRYLLLWYHGGFYADVDIFPARSMDACPSLQPFLNPPNNSNNISLIVGIEIDEPYASPQLMRNWHWSRSFGFTQYAMYAPQRFSPLLRRVIVRVLAHARQQNERHRRGLWSLFRAPSYDEKIVLEATGPGVFTDAILDGLSETLGSQHWLVRRSVVADDGIGDLDSEQVSWAPFHRIDQRVCVDADEAREGDMGGFCVLPVNVWGNGQRHSGAEGFNSVHACLNHRFGRMWKKGWWEYLVG
ncbi:hypothetical protein BDW42DRAFT_170706 [Aspergillus taichungensis]|uniref:Alpha-1,6-mannosyltransferase subunit n=1 Tax=Aspergillus taichungensis TaxID=482145 RepID=A0A2J5HTA2_9EURO|nr:hypothetical protein BDW42DRAFT_170706 [Aspergillus taichungensis]